MLFCSEELDEPDEENRIFDLDLQQIYGDRALADEGEEGEEGEESEGALLQLAAQLSKDDPSLSSLLANESGGGSSSSESPSCVFDACDGAKSSSSSSSSSSSASCSRLPPQEEEEAEVADALESGEAGSSSDNFDSPPPRQPHPPPALVDTTLSKQPRTRPPTEMSLSRPPGQAVALTITGSPPCRPGRLKRGEQMMMLARNSKDPSPEGF